MKAVFDENLPPGLPRALAAVIPEHDFAHTNDVAGRGATDEAIFALLSADQDAVLVTQDRRQKRTPHIQAALRASGLTVVFLAKGWADLDNVKRLSRFCLWWPQIAEAIETCDRGAWFEVPSNTRVTQLKPLPGRSASQRDRRRHSRKRQR